MPSLTQILKLALMPQRGEDKDEGGHSAIGGKDALL